MQPTAVHRFHEHFLAVAATQPTAIQSNLPTVPQRTADWRAVHMDAAAPSVELALGKIDAGEFVPDSCHLKNLRLFTGLPVHLQLPKSGSGTLVLRSKLQFFYPTRGGNESGMTKQRSIEVRGFYSINECRLAKAALVSANVYDLLSID
jgi:hypothetical protein